jgi:phosphate transport system substrate-binding protein
VRSFLGVSHRALGLVVGVWLTLSTSGCQSVSVNPPEITTLRIASATSLRPMLEDLTQQYRKGNAQIIFDLQFSDSAISQAALLNGETDIAGLSWPSAMTPPPQIKTFPVARDGLAIVVNPRNRTSNLTLLQLKALYQGEILSWKAFKGQDLEPVLVSREEGSGSRVTFENAVLGEDRVTLSALVMPSSSAVVDYVARHEAAVGYVTMAALTQTVTAVAVEDVLPTQDSVSRGLYPLTRLLALALPADPKPTAQAFTDYVLSPAGQAIVARFHARVR